VPIGQEFGIRLKLKNDHWRVPVPAPGPCQAVCVTANTYNLFQQRHPLRVRVPAATNDAVQVDAAGHGLLNLHESGWGDLNSRPPAPED
jgi:hypothetical protein